MKYLVLALRGLAFLADDLLAGVAHALALVGLRRVIGANVSGDGADLLLVGALQRVMLVLSVTVTLMSSGTV